MTRHAGGTDARQWWFQDKETGVHGELRLVFRNINANASRNEYKKLSCRIEAERMSLSLKS